jgi:uncharacterized OB-fold protein
MTQPYRLPPDVSGLEAPFWTDGGRGELSVLRCQDCRYWIHPPTIICPECLSRKIDFEATTGRGTLFSFAVSHLPAGPDVPVPYTIALVELPEQTGLRLLTNLVNCDPREATVDMPVKVLFENHDDTFIPVFEPDAG